MNSRLPRLFVALALLLAAVLTRTVVAQIKDTSGALHPPAGSNVALIVFEDLQCPDCARAAPVVKQAAEKYKIPVVRYNFPLPQHNYAVDAAIMAEYFASKSPELGVEFREFMFQNQNRITRVNLHSVEEEFAAKHGTGLPFVVDPQGQFAAKVKKDQALGQRLGVDHTPTIYVVANTRNGPYYQEVIDRSQLFQVIEQMRAMAVPAESQVSSEKTSAKTTSARRAARSKAKPQ